MLKTLIASLTVFAVTAVSTPAAAADYPTALVDRPITLPQGMLELGVAAEVNLSKDQVGKPVNFPLYLAYGFTPNLELKIFSETGLCVTGTENGCAKAFNDLGARLTFAFLKDPNMAIGAFGGVVLRSFDPMWLALRAGLDSKFKLGSMFALRAELGLQFGINDRDLGNKELLWLMLEPQLQLGSAFAMYLKTGLGGPLDGFSDFVAIPVYLGGLFALSPLVDVGAEIGFPNLLGKHPLGDSGADTRDFNVFARIRF